MVPLGLAIVAIALVPWRGVDTLAPQCWSMFDHRVPCGKGVAFAAGAIAGLLAGITIRIRNLRNDRA